MKKLFKLLQYYFCHEESIYYSVIIGAVAFTLKIFASFVSDVLTLFLGLVAYAFLMIIPCCSGSIALRRLISNIHMTMVPGIRLYAGAALMFLCALTSLYLYINVLIFSDMEISFLVVLRSFYLLSLFTGVIQLCITSRNFVPIISVSPFVVLLLISRYQEVAALLFLDRNFTVTAFLLALVCWAYGLYRLHTQSRFRKGTNSISETEAWATYDGGFINKLSFGKMASAPGTLLLGYPDGWSGIMPRVAHYFIVTPLITAVGLYIVGLGENWDKPMLEVLCSLFLVFSLFSAVFCIFMSGELVARARLLWLRFGTDRSSLWELIEYNSLKILFVYTAFGITVAIVCALISPLPASLLMHYVLTLVSYSCFNLYFALLARFYHLGGITMGVIIMAGIFMLIFAGGRALSEVDPSYTMLFVFEGLTLVLGIVCRTTLARAFSGADWIRIKLKRGQSLYHLGEA